MRRVLATLGFIAAVSALPAPPARAQEQSMPGGGSSSSSAPSYGLPEALPQPAAPATESDTSVSIPIPGGGQITVDGPAAPVRNPLPPLGGDTWSIHQGAPYNPGTGPLSPQP